MCFFLSEHFVFFEVVVFVLFFQVQLGLECFKRLSSAPHVISSLGCETMRRIVDPEQPNRSVQRSHRPHEKNECCGLVRSWHLMGVIQENNDKYNSALPNCLASYGAQKL